MASFACFAFSTSVDVSSSEPISLANGITARTRPPFEIDDFWKKELGSLECEKINNSNFFLCAISEDGSDPQSLTSVLHNWHYGLLLQGCGYNGFPAASSGTILGGEYPRDGTGRVSTIGDMLIHFAPRKVINPR